MTARYWIEGPGRHCLQRRNSPPEFRYRKSGGAPEQPAGDHFPVRRNRRYPWPRLRWPKNWASAKPSPSATCPVPSLVRESDMALMTRAGAGNRRGVHQSLHHPTGCPAAAHRRPGPWTAAWTAPPKKRLTDALTHLPGLIDKALGMNADIQQLAERFAEKHHALVPWPRRPVPHRHGRGAETERNFLHPRRSLTPPAS